VSISIVCARTSGIEVPLGVRDLVDGSLHDLPEVCDGILVFETAKKKMVIVPARKLITIALSEFSDRV
jgi:hypothetical protein